MNRWKPNVTVATVVERERRTHADGSPSLEKEYLLVHEHREGKNVFNQPAGHLEKGESLIEAATRETLEESGWSVEVTGLIGIYRFIAPNNMTYMRHAFAAQAISFHPERPLDDGIINAQWLSYHEIIAKKNELRSNIVIETIEDYQRGEHYPLSLLHEPNKNR